jgi:hypothetical protein
MAVPPSDPEVSRVLRCADCGRTVPWHSDEAREWPTVDDSGRFGTICPNCYRSRYGDDEVSEYNQRTRDEQHDERGS